MPELMKYSDQEILEQHECMAGQCLHTNATQCIEALRPDWISLVRANQCTEVHPAWSLLKAANRSLNEHQVMMKDWRDCIKRYVESESAEDNTLILNELLKITGLLVDD